MEVTNSDMLNTRIEMQAARIAELEKENAHYIELLSANAEIKKKIIGRLHGGGSDGEILDDIEALIK